MKNKHKLELVMGGLMLGTGIAAKPFDLDNIILLAMGAFFILGAWLVLREENQ